LESGPVVLFNFTERGESDILVLSPFSQFMATSFYQTNNFFEYGVMGSMSYVPMNYNHSMMNSQAQVVITPLKIVCSRII
jgi:hypothetical protein